MQIQKSHGNVRFVKIWLMKPGKSSAGPTDFIFAKSAYVDASDSLRQFAQRKKRSQPDKQWKKIKGGEIRKLEYGTDDIRCVFAINLFGISI